MLEDALQPADRTPAALLDGRSAEDVLRRTHRSLDEASVDQPVQAFFPMSETVLARGVTQSSPSRHRQIGNTVIYQLSNTAQGFLRRAASALVVCLLACEADPGLPPADGGAAAVPPSGSGGNLAGGGASAGAAGAVGGGAPSNGGAFGAAGTSAGLGGAPQATGGGESVGGTSQGGATPTGGMANTGGQPDPAGGASGSGNGGGSSGRGPTMGGGGGSGGSAGAGGMGNINIWLAGDSTVANGPTPCPTGWGKHFDELFDSRVTVVNSAVGGRSVRTWLYNVTTSRDAAGECVLQTDAAGEPTIQARWRDMLSGMKTGDYLFIQFGINDGAPACDRHVGIQAFKTSYGVMAAAAKSRGAQPIFVTPASAVACNGSTARPTRGAYVQATVDAGAQYEVPVIDLHALTVALYTARGFCPIPGGDVSASTSGPVGAFFCDDHTHFSDAGSIDVAKLIAQALREQAMPLRAYLK